MGGQITLHSVPPPPLDTPPPVASATHWMPWTRPHWAVDEGGNMDEAVWRLLEVTDQEDAAEGGNYSEGSEDSVDLDGRREWWCFVLWEMQLVGGFCSIGSSVRAPEGRWDRPLTMS